MMHRNRTYSLEHDLGSFSAPLVPLPSEREYHKMSTSALCVSYTFLFFQKFRHTAGLSFITSYIYYIITKNNETNNEK